MFLVSFVVVNSLLLFRLDFVRQSLTYHKVVVRLPDRFSLATMILFVID